VIVRQDLNPHHLKENNRMKYCSALFLLLAVLGAAAWAQGGSPANTSASDRDELAQFKTYIQQHPRALAELQKNPQAIQTAAFAEDFRGVGQYLAQHPRVKELLKSNPKFFNSLSSQVPERKRHWYSW
jgi:hypothetical protein